MREVKWVVGVVDEMILVMQSYMFKCMCNTGVYSSCWRDVALTPAGCDGSDEERETEWTYMPSRQNITYYRG
jgi:hypothetical protein